MLDPAAAFHGIGVHDVAEVKAFYTDVLGLEVSEEADDMFRLHVGGGSPTLVYERPGHEPAAYTVLNFAVPDVEATVAELTNRGVVFERYEGTPFETDADGVYRGDEGPQIAWFQDPAGNVMSVIKS
jgi:catechol 2,3-dioxygenase-like lactoylglutathione lyase family enzyme